MCWVVPLVSLGGSARCYPMFWATIADILGGYVVQPIDGG